MGTGVSRQGNVRKKVLAVNAFEEAGKRHRRKKFGGKKSSSTTQNDPANDPQDNPVPLQKTHWAKIKERSILQSELQSRANLKLSDFSKVVRKRTLSKEDEEPIDIPYFTKEKVEPDELCHVCSVYTGRETYPCRICYKVYHESCLRKLGQCNDPASSVLLKRALKPVGWSCQDCDDLSNLLTEEEIFTLYEALDKHNVTQDSNVSIEDYLNYRRCIFKESFNTEISKEELQEEIARFHRIDRDNSGSITWWEFINYESINILKKRSKNSILQLLSPREIDLVRVLFRTYDENGTGNIAEYNARKAIAAFYTLFLECDEALNGFAVMSMNKHEELAFVLNETLSFTMDCEADETRKMSWKDFLWELCIYIIAARPNLSQVPVEGSEWTKGVVVSTEMDCDLKRTTL